MPAEETTTGSKIIRLRVSQTVYLYASMDVVVPAGAH